MLIFTAKYGSLFRIEPADVDPNTPIGELFAGGPIEIVIATVKHGQVRLGIRADSRFLNIHRHPSPQSS